MSADNTASPYPTSTSLGGSPSNTASLPSIYPTSYNPHTPPHDFHIIETLEVITHADSARFDDRIMYVPEK